MRLFLLGLALLAGDVLAQSFVHVPSAPLLPVSSFASFPVRQVQAPIRTVARPVSNFNRVVPSGNPCAGNPCGPNTRCDVGRNGFAQCRCIGNYVPDDNTIDGCKPQCDSDGDCPNDYRCRGQQCERVCKSGACGHLADCVPRNHRAVCSCPLGYRGNAEVSCTRTEPDIREIPDYDIDPCEPNPCGDNANCQVRGDRPVCSCPEGYEGDPLTRCIQGECIRHSDCPGHQACQALRCIDPCDGVCGDNAECETKNNQPICSCPRGFTGDPFRRCRQITADDVCNPSPCGPNTNCRAQTDRSTGLLRAVCSCIDNYIGSDPINQGCRPECVRDGDCGRDQHCRDNRCRNPCVDGCGTDAYCDVRNHQAQCSCHQYAKGNPRDRCYFECTEHEKCSRDQACVNYECVDPCVGACGENANCKVENHTPICSCPSTMTGDPFVRCRRFTIDDLCADNPCGTNADCTPGKDRNNNDRPVCTCPHGYIGNPLVSCRQGECERHGECRNNQACYRFECTSPCFFHNDAGEAKSVCGRNAECSVRDHQPVCRCARGWTGNPLEECAIAPNARVAGGRAVAGRSGSIVVSGGGSRRYYN